MCSSYGCYMNRLLLINSGGTLGMTEGPYGFTTQPCNLKKIILSNSNIASKSFRISGTNYRNSSRLNGKLVTFITPSLRNGIVAMVDIFELPYIIDSANVSVEEFCAIAEVIRYFYDGYDGFLIIHGTDTLSYASSFLSFMITGLAVPVIFTGSMLPMMVKGSDGEGNLFGAIESCLLIDSPGVYLYFNGWLHHGARATKVSSESFDGFYSRSPIRIENLAKNVNKRISNQIPINQRTRPVIHTKMSSDIGIFKLFPCVHPYHFKAALNVYKAVILETYGSGTFPSNRADLLEMIRDYIWEGGVVVNVSQCLDGNVSDKYEASNILPRLGVLSAKNITTESAFAKLSLLVANYPNEIKQWFPVSLCGEIDKRTDTKMLSFNYYR